MIECPFPYFGGKSRCADLIWDRFGDVPHYVEPFFGSGAVLFARPSDPQVETVNDLDGYVANFWRAVQAAPDEVAEWLNWPVNEIDLEARHRWLVHLPRKTEHLRRMKHEPDYYDAKIAGWWCWGLAQWIGGGWCSGDGAAKRPDGFGKGVHRKRPLDDDRSEWLRDWMRIIAERLRTTRVCCGDWSRIVTPCVTLSNWPVCGVFLDPPYSGAAGREPKIYRSEDLSVAHDVREWCIANGNNPAMRIALCGYDGEHEMPDDWECVHWTAPGGYAHLSGDPESRGKANRRRERIWFSPYCIRTTLFR